MSMAVSNALTRDFVELEVRLLPSDGKTAAWLSSVSEVLSKQYDDDYVYVRSRMICGSCWKIGFAGIRRPRSLGEDPSEDLE